MDRPGFIRLLFVIALVGAAVMIAAAIFDFATGIAGWSAWVGLICGLILAIIAVYRIIRPFTPTR